MMSDRHTNEQLPGLSLIVAMTKEHVIGSGKSLPWQLPEDLQLFKKLTMGGTIIMGRKTYDTIGRPLPGRHNIVVSRSELSIAGIQTASSLIDALTFAAQYGKPVFVIGGAELYRKALQIASELHISWVKGAFSGDTYFPDFNPEDWIVVAEEDYSDFRYVRYNRKTES